MAVDDAFGEISEARTPADFIARCVLAASTRLNRVAIAETWARDVFMRDHPLTDRRIRAVNLSARSNNGTKAMCRNVHDMTAPGARSDMTRASPNWCR
jgi:hypothetical protein